MVKIRLMRIGAKKRPFYRVVAVDERNKRTGGYLELLGTYNPLTEPKEIILKQDRIDDWVKKGAQLSDGFLRIIGKAPQRPPRKPKKEKKSPQEKQPGEKTSTKEGEAKVSESTSPDTDEPASAGPDDKPESELENQATPSEQTDQPESVQTKK